MTGAPCGTANANLTETLHFTYGFDGCKRLSCKFIYVSNLFGLSCYCVCL